jgi:hypothetical protein
MPVEAVMANFVSAYQSSGRTVQIIVNADISAPPCVYVNPFKLAERLVKNIKQSRKNSIISKLKKIIEKKFISSTPSFFRLKK